MLDRILYLIGFCIGAYVALHLLVWIGLIVLAVFLGIEGMTVGEWLRSV